jgi:predicted transcriptional regulator
MLVESNAVYFDETNTEDASKMLWILSDSYSRTILKSVKDIPKSCMEISAECKIPISTVYRRMQCLHDQKLVHTTGSISDDGKKYFLYKSRVRSVDAQFDEKLTVKITYS